MTTESKKALDVNLNPSAISWMFVDVDGKVRGDTSLRVTVAFDDMIPVVEPTPEECKSYRGQWVCTLWYMAVTTATIDLGLLGTVGQQHGPLVQRDDGSCYSMLVPSKDICPMTLGFISHQLSRLSLAEARRKDLTTWLPLYQKSCPCCCVVVPSGKDV